MLDATIVNVALPSIQRALHFSSEASLQWVVNAYVLAFGGFLLLGGRVADRYGLRRVFVLGTLFFAAGSLVGGLAGSPGLLIAARAAQGLGGAFMSPAALSLVTVIFAEGEPRARSATGPLACGPPSPGPDRPSASWPEGFDVGGACRSPPASGRWSSA
ncbi:MAG: MFS transporter [Acidimicrobiales bacterium]